MQAQARMPRMAPRLWIFWAMLIAGCSGQPASQPGAKSPADTRAAAQGQTNAAAAPVGTGRVDASLATPRAAIAAQLELLRKGDAAHLRDWFTPRQQAEITADAVQQAQAELADATLEQLVADVQLGKTDGRQTAKILMKNGRALTTLILIDGRWRADTVWFR